MSFADFIDNYTNTDICHMLNTSFFSLSKTWHEGASVGEWVKPDRAGGCGNNDTFLKNPQVDTPRVKILHCFQCKCIGKLCKFE